MGASRFSIPEPKRRCAIRLARSRTTCDPWCARWFDCRIFEPASYSPAAMDLRTNLLFVDALDLRHGFARERWQIGSTTIFRNLLGALPAGNRTTDRVAH